MSNSVFIHLLSLTGLFWAVSGLCGLFVLWLINKTLRYLWTRAWFKKFLKWGSYALFVLVLFTFGLSDGDSVGSEILIWALVIIYLVPMCILLFFQICFWVYHWLAHGDPFYEPGVNDRRDVIVIHDTKKREKKFCPICNRKTFCKVQKTTGGFWIHTHKE